MGNILKIKKQIFVTYLQLDIKTYDYLILGHIHHYTCATVSTTKDGNPTQVISVPSIVGSCPYSQKIMKTLS